MSENTKKYSWLEWPKIIICGVFLGTTLGYFLYNIRHWWLGYVISWPINWCCYCVLVSSFHLLEFFLTAIYRPTDLCFDSYLVNQSTYYMVTTFVEIVEFWIEYYIFPKMKQSDLTTHIGLVVTLFGMILRACSEIKMEANFTHTIREEKVNSHELIVTGVYSFFRHPSYTGWFYFCIGREIMLKNPISLIIVSFIQWFMLYYRIPYEEKFLLSFFTEYEEYRKHTHIFIPFIPAAQIKEF